VAFSPAFTAAQAVGFPSQIVFTDTSTGTDGTIVSRRIYLKKADGTFLVPTGTSTEYIAWALADTSTTVDALDKDYSLLVTVQWLDAGGAILYDKVVLYGFTLYNETFDYSTTQMLTGNAALFNDNNFWQNKSDLRTYIDGGNNAISLATDQYGAQQCYDAATALRVGSQYYFNENV